MRRLDELRECVTKQISTSEICQAYVDAYVAQARSDVATYLSALIAATCDPRERRKDGAAKEVKNVDIARWLGVDKGTVSKWLSRRDGSSIPIGSYVLLTDFLSRTEVTFPPMAMRRCAGVAAVATLFAARCLDTKEALPTATCYWISKVLEHEAKTVAELQAAKAELAVVTRNKLHSVMRRLADKGEISLAQVTNADAQLAEFELWVRPILVAYERVHDELRLPDAPVRPQGAPEEQRS